MGCTSRAYRDKYALMCQSNWIDMKNKCDPDNLTRGSVEPMAMMTLALIISIFINIYLAVVVVKMRKRLKRYEKGDSPHIKYDAREKTVSVASTCVEDGLSPPGSQHTAQHHQCKQHSSHSRSGEENTKKVFVKEEENVPSLQHQTAAHTPYSTALPTLQPDVGEVNETAPQTFQNQTQQSEAAATISTKAGNEAIVTKTATTTIPEKSQQINSASNLEGQDIGRSKNVQSDKCVNVSATANVGEESDWVSLEMSDLSDQENVQQKVFMTNSSTKSGTDNVSFVQ